MSDVLRSARWVVVALALSCSVALASARTDRVLANVHLPAGFRLEVVTDEVPGARSLALGAQGALFVGTRGSRIYAVVPQAGAAARVRVIADQLNMPNGVAFRDGALYVAEVHRIIRFDAIEASLDAPPAPKVVRDDLPRDRHYGWRYIAFGPDGRLYLPLGAPCNVCNDPRYAVITRMNADGSNQEVFARGVRNSLGLAWRPGANELWFTDNGRDFLGAGQPPCELNAASRIGMDFGFPYCHGGGVKDPEFGHLGDCSRMAPPVQALDAHAAPLGLKFYTGEAFPPAWRNRIFIAEHGSTNRGPKSGFRISAVTLDGDRAVSYEPFAHGFARGGEIFGRPVDLLIAADGSMFVSDDYAGAIYRITYSPP